MGHPQNRSVTCPAHGAAIELGAIAVIGTSILAAAHRDGSAAMRQARDDRAQQLWDQRLSSARVSAANAVSVARQAVARVHDLEAEVAALRRAVNSRDVLIRSLSHG